MATNPMYSQHLQFAPTFRWGGREWGPGDEAAFRKRMGKRYDRWSRRHPNAARVFNPTEQQIYSLVQPQLTGIDQERKSRQAYYQRLMQDLGGFSTSLMGMLGGIGPAIGDVYTQGADTMRAAGEGYSDALNADTAADAARANEVLSSIGAPEGQQLAGGDPGGVLAGLAGWIPETLMRQQGGAFAEAAGQLPKTASIEAQLMMKDLLRSAQEEDQDFSSQVLQVLQGLPGMRSQIQSEDEDKRLAQQKFALDKLEAERDWYLKQAALAQAAGDDQRADEYLRLAQQREERMRYETMGLDVQGNPQPGYYRDPRTGQVIPKGYRINPKTGQIERIGSKSGGLTANQRRTVMKDVINLGNDEDFLAEIADLKKNTPLMPGAPSNRLKVIEDQLFEKYKGMATTPSAKKQLRKIIRQAVRRSSTAPAASTGGASLSGLLEP